MEFFDVKIRELVEHLLGREVDMDLEAIMMIIGVFMISWTLRAVKQALASGSIVVIRLDKTVEENTDAMIENARALKQLRRTLEKGKQDADHDELL
jgi:hypothetical protein